MDELERSVRDCVHGETELPFDLDADADITRTVVGDDLDDLLKAFSARFGVDMAAYRWYHHTGPEGCSPLWLLFTPWWARKAHLPVRVRDLVQSARERRWVIKYPAGRGGAGPPG